MAEKQYLWSSIEELGSKLSAILADINPVDAAPGSSEYVSLNIPDSHAPKSIGQAFEVRINAGSGVEDDVIATVKMRETDTGAILICSGTHTKAAQLMPLFSQSCIASGGRETSLWTGR